MIIALYVFFVFFLYTDNSTMNSSRTFTERLKEETRDNHKILDTHYFVKSIFKQSDERNDKQYSTTTEYYLDLHLIMLHEINFLLQQSQFNFQESFNCFLNNDYSKRPDVKNDILNCKSMISLINKLHMDSRNKELLSSHMYIWWLGVLYGGQMIKRSINKQNPHLSEYTDLIFDLDCNVKEFILYFKEYLNNSIIQKDDFINNVNTVYLLIKDVFDELTI